MKVILITRVPKLGNIGDVVNVKDGYGKNFLIPQKKAIFFNSSNYKIFEEQKQQFETQNQNNSAKAESYKLKLSGKDIVILGNASDDGRLYGSITTTTIANKINDLLGEKIVSRIGILLKKPIKDIGVFNVKVDLYSGIIAEVRVIVSRSESEIENLLSNYQNSEKNPEAKPKKSKKDEKSPELESGESAAEVASA